ncbi:MAG: hypothetical protein F6K45_07575 [Kamptonema sp. SIO1D9]|nr:hypothetical protein [Kamptonema sp. SIO1D9]
MSEAELLDHIELLKEQLLLTAIALEMTTEILDEITGRSSHVDYWCKLAKLKSQTYMSEEEHERYYNLVEESLSDGNIASDRYIRFGSLNVKPPSTDEQVSRLHDEYCGSKERKAKHSLT